MLLMKLGDKPFFKLGFTPCKAETPLQGMKLQGKEEKEENRRGK